MSRWKHCLDVMILKMSGITLLSKLCTIVLFAVDCNYAFKHIGWEMMKVAKKTKSLAPKQCGSRKSHRAIDLTMNKALTYDLFCQPKWVSAVCSNDAKSCYNLIGHTQASLCMQQMGVPWATVDCLFITLQEAKNFVRTDFRDLIESYGGTSWLIPIHGIYQGNGACPAIWVVVTTPLLNILWEKGYGISWAYPISQRTIHFAGYAFVDATDLVQMMKYFYWSQT